MSRNGAVVAIALDEVQQEDAGQARNVVVGKDILELLSTAMYMDPRTLYREYVQNAADGIDDAVSGGLLGARAGGRIEIEIDPVERQIRIQDNGSGVHANDASRILTALGSSKKR